MKRFTLIATLLAAFVCAGQAQAAITAVGSWFSGQVNKISDNSGDYLFNRRSDDVGTVGSNTILNVGDVLLASFNVESIEDLTGGGGTRIFGGARQFLTGISAIQVIGKTTVPGIGKVVDFAPLDAAARADLLAGIGGVVAPNPLYGALVAAWDPGTMIAFYDDPLDAFTRVGAASDDGDGAFPSSPGDIGTGPFLTENAFDAAAVNGVKILEVGFGDPTDGIDNDGDGTIDESFWQGLALGAGDDFAALKLISSGTNGAVINFGLEILKKLGEAAGYSFGQVDGTHPTLGSLTKYTFAGNANAQGTNGPPLATTPYDAFNDFNAQFKPVNENVPEPASMLAWLGALGGLGLLRLRSRRRS